MLQALESDFLAFADVSKAISMKAYMKNQFEFYGIPSPIRKEIQKRNFNSFKPLSAQDLQQLCAEMWAKPQREWQYAAIDLLSSNKKIWQKNFISDFEKFLITKAWWDTVDNLSSQVVVPFFKKFTDTKSQWVNQWKHSENMWLRRVSIIHQLKEKNQMDTELLTECILLNSDSKEFFLQKAIGWALREYAKTNPEWVLRFVEVNQLKSLSKREAVKNIIF